jgi:serine/threonine protein kinase
MALEPGQHIAHYRIDRKIGEGGVGEEWAATDPRLNRPAAIKALPAALAADPERLARFKREAQLLAALNHPNIGTIYGLEQVDDASFLALELVEGEARSAC